jgi:hypothetical protein
MPSPVRMAEKTEVSGSLLTQEAMPMARYPIRRINCQIKSRLPHITSSGYKNALYGTLNVSAIRLAIFGVFEAAIIYASMRPDILNLYDALFRTHNLPDSHITRMLIVEVAMIHIQENITVQRYFFRCPTIITWSIN